jgi:hypothetical protein
MKRLTMKKQDYKQLFIPTDACLVPNNITDNNLVWISRYWDIIYDTLPEKYIEDILKDYTLLWCESDEEFEEVDSKLDNDNPNIFAYSFEFDYPSLLVKTEYLKSCQI